MQAITNAIAGLRQHLAFVFLVCCAVIIGLSFVVAAVQFGWMAPELASIFATIAVVAIVIWWRQTSLGAEIRVLKNYALNMGEYEADIERRLEKVGNTLNVVMDRLPENDPGRLHTVLTKIDQLETRMSGLEAREQGHGVVSPPPVDTRSDRVVDEGSTENTSNAKTSSKPSQRKLEEDMLSLHLQPVVELPTRHPIYFDAFMRMKRDQKDFLDDAEFKQVVDSGGLTPTIEKKVLMSSTRMLSALMGKKKKTGLFCELSAPTLSDAKSFREISNYLESNAGLSDELVLKISQRDLLGLKTQQIKRLNSLVELGYELALDKVRDLKFDPAQMVSTGIRYLRVPAHILLHADFGSNGQDSAMQLIHSLGEHGISIVAIEVERETEAMGLIDLDVRFASGLLFAPPRPVKAELL